MKFLIHSNEAAANTFQSLTDAFLATADFGGSEVGHVGFTKNLFLLLCSFVTYKLKVLFLHTCCFISFVLSSSSILFYHMFINVLFRAHLQYCFIISL